MEFEIAKTSASRVRKQRPVHQSSVDVPLGRVQPQDTDVEEAVLGALMLEKDAYGEVADILSPNSFYDPGNARVYEAITKLAQNEHPIDMLTVTKQLREDNALDEVGGPMRISELTSRVSSAANVEYHARIVAQKYLARELISYSSQIEQLAFDESIDVFDLMQEAEGKLFELSNRSLKRDVTQIDPVITQALKKMEESGKNESGLSGLQTGYRDLDRMTSGWQPSDLIIIAARPAMGKTAFVLSMAKQMAIDLDIPVAVFSLEMSNLQLVNRLISNVCRLEGEKIKSGQLTKIEWDNVMARVKDMYSAPLYVDDTPSLSVFELRSKARRLVREHNVKLIIIDYLQLMNATGMKFGSREQEVSTISRSLKQLAKELNIPIIALSQLNRNVESRVGDKSGARPQLSDLRESGAIEQDADMVCFIHRPEYYTRSSEDGEGNDIRGVAEFIIAKHRSGSVGDVKMRFRAKFASFENWDDNQVFETAEAGTVASQLNAGDATGENGAPIPPMPSSDPFNSSPIPQSGNVDFLSNKGDAPPF